MKILNLLKDPLALQISNLQGKEKNDLAHNALLS